MAYGYTIRSDPLRIWVASPESGTVNLKLDVRVAGFPGPGLSVINQASHSHHDCIA
jgi:hypothetical protein